MRPRRSGYSAGGDRQTRDTTARHVKRHDPDDEVERPRWHDPDDEDDPRAARFEECETESEEEKEDRHPVLGGTLPMARIVFLSIVVLIVLGGAVALIKALGTGFSR
jgi:hypothetical protein